MSVERVDFMVVGAQRCGTTTLHWMLRQVPGVAMPRKKEPNFFAEDASFPANGTPDYSVYHAHWDPQPAGSRRLVGEISPNVLYHKKGMDRIRAYNPDAKIVAIFRDPVERAYSSWSLQFQKRGVEALSFDRATLLEPQRISDDPATFPYAYLDRGRYAPQIERIRANFPSEQTLFLRFEDLADRPLETLRTLTSFLGVEAPSSLPPVHANATRQLGAIHPATAQRLLDELRPDIVRTGELLGWDVSSWLIPHGHLRQWFTGEIARHTINLARNSVGPVTRRLGLARRAPT